MLIVSGRYLDAFKAYKKLRKHPIIAARDLYYSHVLYEQEVNMAKGVSYWSRLWDCFTVPRIRRANVAASTVMLAQQMCGINSELIERIMSYLQNNSRIPVISFYSSTVFVEGGASATDALYASLGFGAVNFTFALPALFLIDRFGRRSLLLSASHSL